MKFTIPSETMSKNSKKAMPPCTAVKHGEGSASGEGPNGGTKHAKAGTSPVDFKGAPKGYSPKALIRPPGGMMPRSEK